MQKERINQKENNYIKEIKPFQWGFLFECF